jgi:hypothetical protein
MQVTFEKLASAILSISASPAPTHHLTRPLPSHCDASIPERKVRDLDHGAFEVFILTRVLLAQHHVLYSPHSGRPGLTLMQVAISPMQVMSWCLNE